MASWEDVRRLALALPETTERLGGDGRPEQWRVHDKLMAWDRPLRAADLAALGDAAPQGPILGVRVPGLEAKEALLAEYAGVCFTTPHFNGYPAILVQLERISVDDLEDLLVEAWLTQAPKRLATQFLAERADSND